MVDIKLKRIDTTLPLPSYATEGSVGLDMYSRKDVVIKPQEMALVPLNIILVDYPKDVSPFLFPRSSLAFKHHVLQTNGTGVIDLDYRGPDDEICIPLYNFHKELITHIKKGDKIAQLLFIPSHNPVSKGVRIKEVQEVSSTSRHGFGSTGGYNEVS
jgi:dUTP pyrophosphatase